MSEAPAAPGAATSMLRAFARQLSKGQMRGLLAAVVTSIAGFAGQVYRYFIADPLTDKSVTWNDKLPGHALAAGLGFVVAFIIFFMLRRFLFRAAAIVSLIVIAGGAISYFSGINIDFHKAQQYYDSASGWIWGQCKALMGIITSNIPGSSGAGLGAWLGFRRPRA